MRHRKAGIKLGRTTSHRTALFRNMVTSLLKYERIQTTDPKAKELRRWADNVITLAKRGDLHARRQALAIVMEKDVVNKLFAEAAERFGTRAGGYTRIIKLGRRPGDAAPVSVIELIAADKPKDKKTKKKKEEKASKPKVRKDKSVKADKEAAASAAPETAAKDDKSSGAAEKKEDSPK